VSEALESRSAVDLKDKWRNLLRIAMLPVLYKRREATVGRYKLNPVGPIA
jgi:hypothetical protein